MPNHVHLIWKLNKVNGKELPHTSFLKFTSRQFSKELMGYPEFLFKFFVNLTNKRVNFWQRDSLAFELFIWWFVGTRTRAKFFIK